MLRFITYLAPSLPEELFAAVADHVGQAIGEDVRLEVEPAVSGPPPDGTDPFTTGAADVGFICAPSYVALDAMTQQPVVAVAAPVFTGAGVDGEALYYSDIVVPRSHPAQDLGALAGARWGYNDRASLSGYRSLVDRVDLTGAVHTGSHLRSLALLERGEIEAAAIDSVVLAMRRRDDPTMDERVRVVERLGPYPIQPVVCASGMSDSRRSAVVQALLTLRLPEFGLERYIPVSRADYARISV
ncbi:MAG TPA: PhnD/SsuA/transferrin family substrate-binding protein [Acidimicrobiales bacterium]|nr:PhnD/SsuA/transferrin family substrate-binding protein [Acidimicrobiales bacterium]